ncbi:MAG: T9SS type A sorting domain-containing protein [bacterium]|nr:T9SS type A sorting domain-containing protein [bacterium]
MPDFTIVRQGANSDDYDLFGSVMTCPGDLNGDGYDDVFVASAGIDDTAWVYFGGSNIDTIPDIKIPLYIKHAVSAGDINGDGYDDLLASYDVSFSGDGRVYVFYGGPQFNGQWDIRFANWEDSIYQTNFGMAIAGLGDYNGDGVDDFAFSAMGSSSRGVVHIYSGTGVPVDVPENDHDSNDKGISLDHNYPNPFNHSTTIDFSIPRRGHVKLTITNVLGRVVSTLLDESLSSGKHSVEWNAGPAGNEFASGVYYCRLEYEGKRVGRKIVLLK